MISKGIVIGVLVSAPMGPIGMLCIQRTLNKGRWHGFVTGLGAALSDVIYAALTCLGSDRQLSECLYPAHTCKPEFCNRAFPLSGMRPCTGLLRYGSCSVLVISKGPVPVLQGPCFHSVSGCGASHYICLSPVSPGKRARYGVSPYVYVFQYSYYSCIYRRTAHVHT